MPILNSELIKSELNGLSDWIFINNQIEKSFVFKDFIDAISFVNMIALISEKMDHHPDILIHSWNKVKISISTHSEGGVTGKDFELAKKIEERFSNL